VRPVPLILGIGVGPKARTISRMFFISPPSEKNRSTVAILAELGAQRVLAPPHGGNAGYFFLLLVGPLSDFFRRALGLLWLRLSAALFFRLPLSFFAPSLMTFRASAWCLAPFSGKRLSAGFSSFDP